MRKLRFLFVGLAAMLAFALTAAAYNVPDQIEIKRPDKNPPLAAWVGTVKFPHGLHAVLNPCSKCHHKESAKTLGEFLPCTQCHSGTNPKEPTDFYLAWHGPASQSCLGCHTALRAKGGKNPVGCRTACHKPQQ